MKKVVIVFEQGVNQMIPAGQAYFADVSDLVQIRLNGFDSELLDLDEKKFDLRVNDVECALEVDSEGSIFADFQPNFAGLHKISLTIMSPIKTHSNLNLIVQPSFLLSGRNIKVEDIRLQTNLSRCLGLMSGWAELLYSQIDLGFNFFHLTSVCKLGKFGSLYCIGDYSELNPNFFEENDITADQKWEKLDETVNEIKDKGAGIIVDLVLSHCSSLNPIFSSSTEASYNLSNTPHLSAAFELDQVLQSLSQEMSDSRLKFKYSNRIETEEQLQYIMEIIKQRISCLNLQEFFCINTEKALEEFIKSEPNHLIFPSSQDLNQVSLQSLIRKKALKNQGHGKFLTELDFSIIWADASAGRTKESIIREVIKEIQEFNSYQVSRFNRKLNKIYFNIESEIRYHKIELRTFEVTAKKPLVKPYFTVLPDGTQALLNGFIFNPKRFSPDISEKWNYLYRNVITWNDCVKINYGQDLSSVSPWFHIIEAHVESLSKVFSGFRIDNCHGTPLWVTEHLINLSRCHKPNLLVLAELFTNSPEIDTLYTSKIGINLLLRESLSHNCTSSLSKALTPELPASSNLMCLNSPSFSSLSKIPIIIYDFTHDNPTITQLRTSQDLTSNLACTVSAASAIGSTRGYDELIPIQLSVVDEFRTYQSHASPVSGHATYKLMGVDKGIQVFVEFLDLKQEFSIIEVFGDWDGWRVPLRLEQIDEGCKIKKRNLWRCCLEFPYTQTGMKYGFKFCGNQTQWFCDKSQRNYTTWDGFTNNLLIVEGNLPCLPLVSQNLCHFRYRVNLLRDIWTDFGFSQLKVRDLGQDVLAAVRTNPTSLAQYWMISRLAYRSSGPCGFSLGLEGIIDKIEFCCLVEEVGRYQENKKFINGIPFVVKSIDFSEIGKVLRKDDEDFLDVQRLNVGTVVLIKTIPGNAEIVEKINKSWQVLADDVRGKYLFEGLDLDDFSFVIWKMKYENGGAYEFDGIENIRFCGIRGILDGLENSGASEVQNPVLQNLKQGDWYIDYFLARLNQLKSKVLYFFMIDLMGLIKGMRRDLVPWFVIKTLRILEEGAQRYLFRNLINCSYIPDRILYRYTQLSSTLHPQFFPTSSILSSSSHFTSLFTSHIYLLLEDPNSCQSFLSSLISSPTPSLSPSTQVHLIFQISLLLSSACNFSISSSPAPLPEALKPLQAHALFILTCLLNTSTDLESGLVLSNPGDNWSNDSSRSGALIEVNAMLFKALNLFINIESFQQNLKFLASGQESIISLDQWSGLIKKSFDELFYIPSSGESSYVRVELVRKSGIFKDALGCREEYLEYRCGANQILVLLFAPELVEVDTARKVWKKCHEALEGADKLRLYDEENTTESRFMKFCFMDVGIRIGERKKAQGWILVRQALNCLDKLGGLDDMHKEVFSTLSYYGLFMLLKTLNQKPII